MPASEHGSIPPALRLEIGLRDGWCCRVCGKWLGSERGGIHHIDFGGGTGPGMGGHRVHDIDRMIVICWLPGDPVSGRKSCHDLVHGDKLLWQPFLYRVAVNPAVTALQLRRWERRQSAT